MLKNSIATIATTIDDSNSSAVKYASSVTNAVSSDAVIIEFLIPNHLHY